jgi:hypothetical protein
MSIFVDSDDYPTGKPTAYGYWLIAGDITNRRRHNEISLLGLR